MAKNRKKKLRNKKNNEKALLHTVQGSKVFVVLTDHVPGPCQLLLVLHKWNGHLTSKSKRGSKFPEPVLRSSARSQLNLNSPKEK